MPNPCAEGGRPGCENPALPFQPLLLPRVTDGGKGKAERKQGAGEHWSLCMSGSRSQRGCSRMIQDGSRPRSSTSALQIQRGLRFSMEFLSFQHNLSANGCVAVGGLLRGNANLSLCCSDLDSFAAEVAIFADLTSGSQQPVRPTIVQSPFVSKEQTFHS